MSNVAFTPIETHYKGYKFRSRLEARYAVFFDAMREEWEYEPQGYSLPSGFYLPDFFLPRLKLFVEVKGAKPSDWGDDDYPSWRHCKAVQLCEDLYEQGWEGLDEDDFYHHAVAITFGLPPLSFEQPRDNVWVYCFDTSDGSAGQIWWPGRWDLTPLPLPSLCLSVDPHSNSRDFLADAVKTPGQTDTIPDLFLAVPRKARFEHGVNGL